MGCAGQRPFTLSRGKDPQDLGPSEVPRRRAHSQGPCAQTHRADPIQERLATRLAEIPELRYIKLFPGRLTASNLLSQEGKKNPVVVVGGADLVGVELLIDPAMKILQFYALTAAVKGCGRRMVEAVLAATPEDWFVTVLMDWSGGFWQRMAEDYPRLQVL